MLGLLSRNVLMTVLSPACVTESMMWVCLVDMATVDRYTISMVSHGDTDHTDLVNSGDTGDLSLMHTFCT